MECIVGRWRNSRWGRFARKDIWIYQRNDGPVFLHWREGEREHERRQAADVDAARSAAEWLREHGDTYDRWVDWTDLYR